MGKSKKRKEVEKEPSSDSSSDDDMDDSELEDSSSSSGSSSSSSAPKKKTKKEKKAKKEEKEKGKTDKKDRTPTDEFIIPKARGPVTISPIASPLAEGDLLNSVCQLINIVAKEKKKIRRGVKEVVKSLRQGKKGICFIAGNISPIDVISHLPVLCEDFSIPYIFLSTKELLGAAACTKRPTSVVLLVTPTKEDPWNEAYKKCADQIASEVPSWQKK